MSAGNKEKWLLRKKRFRLGRLSVELLCCGVSAVPERAMPQGEDDNASAQAMYSETSFAMQRSAAHERQSMGALNHTIGILMISVALFLSTSYMFADTYQNTSYLAYPFRPRPLYGKRLPTVERREWSFA